MEWRKFFVLTILLTVFFLILFAQETPSRVKVIVDDASVKATPEIGGDTIAKLPLNTVLDVIEKKGEWYKVNIERGGVHISGFIHEMLVEVAGEDRMDQPEKSIVEGAKRTQAEIVAEIELKMEEYRKWIREEKDFDKAIDSLRPLIAKVFQVTDQERQKKLAVEIFLWIGHSYTGRGDYYSAMKEIRNMFEVNHEYGKEVTRNIYDPKFVAVIQLAEKEFLGLITEYSLEVSTDPKEAVIKVNGKEVGLSPEVYRSAKPKFVLEIEKKGYKPIKEEVFLTQVNSRKDFVLESSGRNVGVSSIPKGAEVYLDGKETGKVTDCLLQFVPLGAHTIKIAKENYAEWEEEINIEKGQDPFLIEVLLTINNYEYVNGWGGPGRLLFQQPVDVILDTEENFYVLDGSDYKLKKFSSEGILFSSWEKGGKEFKKLKRPTGIAIDDHGDLYITDARNHSVMKFDKKGLFIKKWGREGTGAQNLRNPQAIVIDQKNDIYVVDSGNNRVVKYSPLGAFKKVWGKQGSSDGEFMFPVAIAVDKKNEIYILDRIRVQKFSSEGEFIASWGKRGVEDGEFNNPKGISVDQDNYVYIADTGNDRIQKFDDKGNFITKWGNKGIDEGQMGFPCSLAIDSKGYVYVVERDNDRIQLFGIPVQPEL